MTAQETGISVGKIVYTFSDGAVVMQYQGREILTAIQETYAGVYIRRGNNLSHAMKIDESQYRKLESKREFAYQFVYLSDHPLAKFGNIYLGKYKV